MPGPEARPAAVPSAVARPAAIVSPRSPEVGVSSVRAQTPETILSKRAIYIQQTLEHFSKRAPLQDRFPLMLQEIPVRNEQMYDTALHEVDHGLLIYLQGGIVTNMTVVPNPRAGYLGLTEFAGLDVPQTQVAAMASSVLHGKGTGGDVFLASYLQPFGISVEEAQARARSMLGRIPTFIRERVARMVASFETVDGKTFAEIVARATLDEQLHAQVHGRFHDAELAHSLLQQSAENHFDAQFVERPKTRQIIDVAADKKKVQTFVVDAPDRVEKKCPQCGQPIQGVHVCPRMRKQEAQGREESNQEQPAAERHPLRRTAYIFTQPEKLVA